MNGALGVVLDIRGDLSRPRSEHERKIRILAAFAVAQVGRAMALTAGFAILDANGIGILRRAGARYYDMT
jgi:hypothetical protein